VSDSEPVDLFRGTPLDERDERLRAGAGELATGSGAFWRQPQFLLWLSATLMLLGLAAILLGWVGASRSILMEEQVPYLISGGLLGLALAFIGATTLLAQWVLVLVREQRSREVARRRDHEQLLERIDALTSALSSPPRRSSR
jgi:hypothetical protein